MIKIDLLTKEISAARSKKSIFNTVSFISRLLHNPSKSNGEKDFGDYVLENFDRIKDEVKRRIGPMFSEGLIKYKSLELSKDKLKLTFNVNNCYVHSFVDSFNGGHEKFRRFYSMNLSNGSFLEWTDESIAKFDFDFTSFELSIKRNREKGKEGTREHLEFLRKGIKDLSSLYNATMSKMKEVGKPSKEHRNYILEVIIHKVESSYETEVILKEKTQYSLGLAVFSKKVVLAPKGNESEYPITTKLIKSEVELDTVGIDTVKRAFYRLPEREANDSGDLLIGLPICKLGYKEVYLVKNEPANYSRRMTTYDLVFLG